MDMVEIIVTTTGLALMGLTLWFFFGKREPKRPASGVIYACPMHPWITSSDPAAECSVCGMKLVRENGGGRKG